MKTKRKIKKVQGKIANKNKKRTREGYNINNLRKNGKATYREVLRFYSA